MSFTSEQQNIPENTPFKEKLDQFLDRAINGMLIIIAAVGTPAVGTIIIRNPEIGLKPYMLIYALLIATAGIFSLFRKKFSYRIKAGVVIALSTITTINGLINTGTQGNWIHYTVLTVIIAAMYFGKIGVASAISSLVVIISAGAIFTSLGVIPVDPAIYMTMQSPYRMITYMASSLMVLGGISILLKYYNDLLIVSITGASESDSLKRLNEELTVAKARIEESEKLFREMFRQHGAVMALVDPDSGIIEDINKAGENYYRLSREKLVGVTLYDIVKTVPRNMIEATLENMKNRIITRFELDQRIGGGEPREIEVYSYLIEQLARPLLFMIVHDITDRKKAERELKIANQQKDRFISILAHDLRNPFSTLIGFSDLLRENHENLARETVAEYISNINRSAHATYDLLENLLTWSRARSGHIAYEPHIFDLTATIDQTIIQLKPTAEVKQIALENETPGRIDVLGDHHMLETVLKNLASNAIKFTPTGGRVCFCVTSPGGGDARVTVTDTGVGITENSRRQLFRLDQPVSTPGTENERGTGLGLLLCKEFVERNGGEISVSSEPGKGSTFTFTVPLAR